MSTAVALTPQNAAQVLGALDDAELLAALPFHEDGVYFGLPEDEYHGDPALGSTDIKNLCMSPEDYWWSSQFNSLREGKDETDAQRRGTAVHVYTLYGPEEFERRYGRCAHSGSTKDGKAERERYAAESRIALPAKDFDRIRQSGTMIRSNPHLLDAFSGGWAEVSVFFHVMGVRCKARLDYLKFGATVDLKSIANTTNRAFPEACKRQIEVFNYPVQAAHYVRARQALGEFVRAGQVYGPVQARPPIGDLLEVAANGRRAAWVWVFWQSQGAPLTWSYQLSPGSPVFDLAWRMVDDAIGSWKHWRQVFGLRGPWVRAEAPIELSIEDLHWWGRQ